MTKTPRQQQAARAKWYWGIPLWILGLAFLAPFAWMLSTSLKQDVDAFAAQVVRLAELAHEALEAR